MDRRHLVGKNKTLLWIPPGFAHGFYVLSPEAEFIYKCTDYYAPEHERSLLWNDPSVAVQWPIIPGSSPLLSPKDKHGLPLMLRYTGVGFRVLGIDIDPAKVEKLNAGQTPACLAVVQALYGQAIDTLVPVSSTRAAEMTKLLENIFRSVNIALVNEMKVLCLRMGMDVHEVIRAAADHDAYDYPFILEHAPLIVDTRNVYPENRNPKVFPA
jgi:UDP-N-acetyl-D-mannosaminuronate dehydrogenase